MQQWPLHLSAARCARFKSRVPPATIRPASVSTTAVVLSLCATWSIKWKIVVYNHHSKFFRGKRQAVSTSDFLVARPHASNILRRRFSLQANSALDCVLPLSAAAELSLQLGSHPIHGFLL